MYEVAILLVGGVIGAAVTYLVCRAAAAGLRAQLERLPLLEAECATLRAECSRAEARASAVEARREAEEKAWQEKIALLQDAERKLSDAFKALSAEALRTNNSEFLKLAQTDLSSREKAIGELVQPLRESLTKVDAKLQDIEVARATAYSGLSEQVKALAESQTLLRSETANLVKALRAPAARGRWGEIQLQRVVEMAGMLEHCDFSQQATLETADGRLRPDLIVRLPYGRHIVVDSKVPLDAYLDALDAPDENARTSQLLRHAMQLRTHIGKLAAKQYWAELDGATDFVVAFVPGEAFFSAALQADPGLIDYGIEQRVLVATPTTLIALLKAVAYGWRQESVAENAQEISRLGREIYDRLSVLAEHMTKVGASLDRATQCYNAAVGTLETRVLVSARRMKEKGIGHDSDLEAPDPIDRTAREIQAPELVENALVARL